MGYARVFHEGSHAGAMGSGRGALSRVLRLLSAPLSSLIQLAARPPAPARSLTHSLARTLRPLWLRSTLLENIVDVSHVRGMSDAVPETQIPCAAGP